MKKDYRIFYKTDNSDKSKTMEPLKYFFFKGRIFNKKELKQGIYVIKDNISSINFIDFFEYIKNPYPIIKAGPKTSVIIKGEKLNCWIKAKRLLLSLIDKNSNRTISTENSEVIIIKDGYLTISKADNVSLKGDIEFDNVSIKSSSLLLDNVNGKLSNLSTTASNIKVQNSNIESKTCSFEKCSNPDFINSTWKVDISLQYLDTILGKEEDGIVIKDDTFNPKESLELRRAYLTYLLSESLRQVNIINQLDINPKLEEIDKKAENLMEEYDRQMAILEDKRETIVNEYQKRKVKNLVNKRN